MKISKAELSAARTCLAPSISISRRTFLPTERHSSMGALGVPYLAPANSAHSKNSPSVTIRSNLASVKKK